MKMVLGMFCLALVIVSSTLLTTVAPSLSSSKMEAFVLHSSICIEGDSNFTAENGVAGGSGISGDPYIIQNWEIDASKPPLALSGISIKHTIAHFIIRNVWVHNGDPRYCNGISLTNVTNGLIENVTSTNNCDGIILTNSCRIDVRYCNVSWNSVDGIHVYVSPLAPTTYTSVSLLENSVFGNNGIGISIGYGWGNLVEGNNVSSNGWGGISVDGSCDNVITRNNASWNKQAGIYLYGMSSNNLIDKNTFSSNEYGVYLVLSSNNNITSNLVSSNSQYGIRLYIAGYNVNNVVNNNYVSLNTNSACDDGANSWNITKETGPNIVGGPYRGGNYYDDYTGVDEDDDGFGDTPFQIPGGGNIDYLPLAKKQNIDGEIASIKIVKYVLKVSDSFAFSAEIKNTGSIDADFWVRYTLYHSGEASWPKNTFFRSQAFNAYVGIGQVHTFYLAWTVPEDAAAGVYDLNVILYAGPKNPDQDPNVPAIDTDTIHFALIVDQDVSFIQVMEIPTFIGQKRIIYNHIAKEDVAKSGTLTFLYLTSMLQVARMVADMGRATSDLHILGKGLTDAFTWAGINKRVAKMRDDGSFDILHVQILGQGAWCYEDTTPLDIDLSLGLPIKTPLNYLNILPEQYLAFETPYFSEIQFDWSYAAYLPAMTDFFPYWKFSGGETWYPCSFYFDNDADVTNNKDNYTKAELETGRPPYFVYIHVVEDAKYLTIQYWLYYVYNDYSINKWDHMQDWDSAVYIIFEKPDLQTPKKVGFCYHVFGYTLDWNDFSLQKEGNHVIVYVALGSHGAYHNQAMSAPPSYIPWDEWYAGGDTLGHENLTNWIIVEKCVHETTLPNEGSKVFCELYHIARGCVEPAPPSVKEDSIVYWPKDFPGVSEAIWHQEDKWRNTEPPWFTLFVAAHSPVNICLEDSSGRRTGVDSSGNVLNEIPDSLYSGPDAEPETVAILNPTENYTVHVYGTSSGTFGLESWIYLCGTESVICNSTGITIQEDQTIDYVIPELPSVFAPMLFMLVLTITALLNRKRLVKIRAER